MTETLIKSEDRSYFTIIPNLVDDLDLDPFAFRLYAHLRRVAGEDGACWQSTRTLAKHCKMSVGKVSQAKQTLEQAKLIKIESREGAGGNYHYITIKDIWATNMATYRERSPGERKARSPDEHPESVHQVNANEQKRSLGEHNEQERSPDEHKKRSPDEQPESVHQVNANEGECSPGEHKERSPGERKKNPSSSKKNHSIKKNTHGSADADRTPEPEQEKPLHQQMFEALATVCAWDIELLTEKQRGQLNQTEKKLRNLRGQTVTPEDVLAFGEWWQIADWRGKRGEFPRPDQVRAEWGRFRCWRSRQLEAQEASRRAEAVRQAEKAQAEAEAAANPELALARRVWGEACAQLKGSMMCSVFSTWIAPLEVLKPNGTFRLAAPRYEIWDWLEHRLRPSVERALQAVMGRPVEVEFVNAGADQPAADEDSDGRSQVFARKQ